MIVILVNNKLILLHQRELLHFSEFTGDELYNDRDGTIYFNDFVNPKRIMSTKTVQLIAILSVQ
jgi:hypothetical protein